MANSSPVIIVFYFLTFTVMGGCHIPQLANSGKDEMKEMFSYEIASLPIKLMHVDDSIGVLTVDKRLIIMKPNIKPKIRIISLDDIYYNYYYYENDIYMIGYSSRKMNRINLVNENDIGVGYHINFDSNSYYITNNAVDITFSVYGYVSGPGSIIFFDYKSKDYRNYPMKHRVVDPLMLLDDKVYLSCDGKLVSASRDALSINIDSVNEHSLDGIVSCYTVANNVCYIVTTQGALYTINEGGRRLVEKKYDKINNVTAIAIRDNTIILCVCETNGSTIYEYNNGIRKKLFSVEDRNVSHMNICEANNICIVTGSTVRYFTKTVAKLD